MARCQCQLYRYPKDGPIVADQCQRSATVMLNRQWALCSQHVGALVRHRRLQLSTGQEISLAPFDSAYVEFEGIRIFSDYPEPETWDTNRRLEAANDGT